MSEPDDGPFHIGPYHRGLGIFCTTRGLVPKSIKRKVSTCAYDQGFHAHFPRRGCSTSIERPLVWLEDFKNGGNRDLPRDERAQVVLASLLTALRFTKPQRKSRRVFLSFASSR